METHFFMGRDPQENFGRKILALVYKFSLNLFCQINLEKIQKTNFMLNTTAYWLVLNQKRDATQLGIHTLLRQEFNRYIYPVAFILSFTLMYFFINKLVYYITSGPYIMSLCIRKHQMKAKSKMKNKMKTNDDKTETVIMLKNDGEGDESEKSNSLMILLDTNVDEKKK